jgi:hypothetical protein
MRTTPFGRAVRWRGGPGLLVAVTTLLGAIWTYVTWHQIFPDTQYYILRAEVLLGMDPYAAERLVREYVRGLGVFEPYPSLWGWERGVAMYRPRVLLPVLSLPFVALFGPGGIVVIPGAAYALYAWATYRLCRLHVAAWPAALVVAVAVSSVQVRIWGLGGLTDSLATAALALLLLALPWRGPAGRWRLVAIAALTAAAGLTRVMAPFTVAAVAALWVWSRRHGDPATRRSWTWVLAADVVGSVAGVVFTAVVSALSVSENLFSQTQTHTWPDLLRALAVQVPHIVGQEAATVLGDPPLLILWVLALVGVILDRTWLAAWLVASALVAMVSIIVLNPAYTEFRYPMPAMPMLALAAALGVRELWQYRRAVRRRRRHPDTAEPLRRRAAEGLGR